MCYWKKNTIIALEYKTWWYEMLECYIYVDGEGLGIPSYRQTVMLCLWIPDCETDSPIAKQSHQHAATLVLRTSHQRAMFSLFCLASRWQHFVPSHLGSTEHWHSWHCKRHMPHMERDAQLHNTILPLHPSLGMRNWVGLFVCRKKECPFSSCLLLLAMA